MNILARRFRCVGETIHPTYVLVALATSCVMYLVGTQTLDKRAAVALNEAALEASADGHLAESLFTLEEALERDPESAEAHYNLALLLSGQPEASAEVFGLSPLGLFIETLRHSASAANIAPGNLEYVRTHAWLALSAPSFGAETNWSVAHDAWTEYLSCLRKRSAFARADGVHSTAEYSVLLRLARIEYIHEGRAAAARRLLEIDAIGGVPKWFCPADFDHFEAAYIRDAAA